MLGHILGSVFRVPFNFCTHDFQIFFGGGTVDSQDMVPRSTVPFSRSLAVTPDTILCCSIEARTHCCDRESDVGTRGVEFSDT